MSLYYGTEYEGPVNGCRIIVSGGAFWSNHSSDPDRGTPNLLPEPLTDEQRAELARARARLDPGPLPLGPAQR
jgi:hypothetical protein